MSIQMNESVVVYIHTTYLTMDQKSPGSTPG